MTLRAACVVVGALCWVIAGQRSFALAAPENPAAARPWPPNVVLIVADDLGYADLGVQGSSDVHTPHIDSLAHAGARLTNAYVTAPVCSPSRAGFMTGRYQQRFGHELNTGPFPPPQVGLPTSEGTIANVLRDRGYYTGAVGKWHLGTTDQFHPMRRGFNDFFGFLSGSRSYVSMQSDDPKPLLRGFRPVTESGYLTHVFTREAVAFIQRHGTKRPFFLYVAYTAPHLPMQATQGDLERFAHVEPERRRKLAAMVAAMDDGVGEILAKLRELEIEDNTIVIFTSDNGGLPRNATRNDPLRGTKGQLYEGGIRVPLLMQWKARLPQALTYDQPVIMLDLLPTLAAAAGKEVPRDADIDGVNLLPHLLDNREDPPHETLYWRYGDQWAIRRGEWKLVGGSDGFAQLFNLSQDIGENVDLSSREPPKVAELKALYNQWNAQLVPPSWSPEDGAAE